MRTVGEILIRLAGKIMVLATEVDHIEDLPTVFARMRSEVDLAEEKFRAMRGQA